MVEQLEAAGIDTFAKLAEADLERLREIIATDGTDDQSVNEETWARQARYLADGDFDGLDEYVESLREEDGNTVDIPEDEAETEIERPVGEDAASPPRRTPARTRRTRGTRLPTGVALRRFDPGLGRCARGLSMNTDESQRDPRPQRGRDPDSASPKSSGTSRTSASGAP